MVNFVLIIALLSVLLFLRVKYLDLYRKVTFVLFVSIVFLMVFLIVIYPSEIIEATRDGILLWANVVLPSLLPFFIGAELLIGLGVVKFIGVLIEPLIRPIFNVPGEASFVFAMSITSGYPMGVKLTSNLRRNNVVTKSEAQRIISFCSTSGPLFMIGAVSIGMFNNPSIGPYIVLAHYLGAISVGIIFRFLIPGENSNYHKPSKKSKIFREAFVEMFNARQKDGRSFGKLLGDSVKESISTLVLVGGLLVTFSVLTKELYLIGFFDYVVSSTKVFSLYNINIPSKLIEAMLTGCIELTMGSKIASEAINASPIIQITLATMIISWSGISVHAQVASIINDTDISLKSYVLSKFIHSILSGVYVYSFLKITDFSLNSTYQDVFSEGIQNVFNYTWLNKLFFSTNLFVVIFLTLVLIAVITGILKRN